MESLHLALVGLALPVRRESREPASQYAAPVGLVGAAAEQAMGAILVHVYGEDALRAHGSHFKSAREVLDDFRKLLRNPIPRASFLTAGVPAPASHLEELANATSSFIVLLSERAAGLHAGSGPSREATFVAASYVQKFLVLLAKSARIRSYLDDLPRLPAPVLQPNVLVDDLVAKLFAADGLVEKSAIIRSLFLILPEVPEAQPDWLEAIERIAIAPTDSDVVLLVSALEKAIPVQLQRAAGKGKGISVVVRQDDPNAIPISIHHLRRSFSEISDQWAADVGNANGRLEKGTLDTPPEDFILDLFALDPVELKEIVGKDTFTAHDIWPFIGAALIRQGTPGPYWFLVRLTDDFGQLKAQVQKAFALGKGDNRAGRQREFTEGIDALSNSSGLAPTAPLYAEIDTLLKASAKVRANLPAAMNRQRATEKAFPAGGEHLMQQVASQVATIGKTIEFVLASAADAAAMNYWARLLCESASDSSDRRPLVSVLRNNKLKAAHTAARKAIRLIDAMDNGPSMHLDDA
jgi:hypothetical protein